MASASNAPSGYEPSYQGGAMVPHQQQQSSSMAAISQLFARLSQEIEEHKPKNCIHFIVDFLCKHYPEHLHGFASIWQMDPDLERERHEVVNFFKAHKISTAVAAHFTNAGYDTLDTLTTLAPDSLVDVEAFNNVKWLPGHKVRLQQIFSEISARVRAYRQQYGNAASTASTTAQRPLQQRAALSMAPAPTYLQPQPQALTAAAAQPQAYPALTAAAAQPAYAPSALFAPGQGAGGLAGGLAAHHAAPANMFQFQNLQSPYPVT